MQKILNFVRENPRIADSMFVEESKDYNALYYLAEQRTCVLYVFPFKRGDKVLLVDGMGGAFTEFLLEKGCEVYAWERSMETLLLHKLRVERAQNNGLDAKTEITQYDFRNLAEDFAAGKKQNLEEQFDSILAFDVLPMLKREEATFYIQCLKKLLKPDGKLVVTSENPEGIRYKAGAEKPYENQGVGLGAKELREVTSKEETGLEVSQCFYPFPDGYFPTAIYSDDYLPKKGELHEQVKLSRNPRVIYFDEDKAFDEAIEEQRFSEVAHTCMLVLVNRQKAADAKENSTHRNNDEKNIYAKFSNNRGEEYRLYTVITEDKNGKRTVQKLPIGELAQGHIWHMHDMDMAFEKQYENSRFSTNAHSKEQEGLRFEFINGTPLSERLDAYLETEDIDGFKGLLDEYVSEIKKLYSKKGFAASEEFLHMFGELPMDSGIAFGTLCCGKPINIDLIPDNILEVDHRWVIIDAEWGFDFEIPVNYVVYRGIHYYLATNTKRTVVKEQELLSHYDIDSEEQIWYENMEKTFQSHIAAQGSTIFSQKLATLAPAVAIDTLLYRYAGYAQSTAYYDYGHGYSEENTFRQLIKPIDGGYTIDIPVTSDVKKLRFDIAENSCIMTDVKVTFLTAQNEKKLRFSSNGYSDKNVILFVTNDPQIEVKMDKLGEGTIRICCGYDSVSEAVIRTMLPKRKR